MHTTIELQGGGGKAAERLAEAMVAMGAQVTRAGDTLVIAARTAECAICHELHAVSAMEDHPKLGGIICPICMRTAERIYRSAQAAASRQMRELVSQLPRIIRDVRGGADEPTYYRGFEG
jgi:hypothetical protein